jgi:uncharacterized protein (TIGR03435 family)
MRRLLRVVVTVMIAFAVGVAGAQAPAFDAASIKPSPPPPVGFSPVVRIGPQPGGRWIATMSTVFDLLRSLYPQNYFNGHDFGGPDWATRARFDINAVAEGDPSREMLNDMARQLLKDRFGLQFHVEDRPVDVWAMVIASRTGTRGVGLTPAAYDCTAFFTARLNGQTPPSVPPRPPGGRPSCGMATDESNGVFHIQGGGMTLTQIASFMEGFAMPERRPIVDRTGVEGRFDVDFRFTIYRGPTTDTTPTGLPLLKEAMEDGLGLRLESRKETRPGLIIDRVSMPSPD